MRPNIWITTPLKRVGVFRSPPQRAYGDREMSRWGYESVLNKFNQLWDTPNVFVTDGAAFVNSANQNPTLTILALTMRACEYLTEEMKRGNL